MAMMKLLLVVAVAVSLMAMSAAAGPTASDLESGEVRLNKLLARSAERPLIPVNGADFDDLVGSPYRPYRLLVWVTSNSGSCAMCNEMRPELGLLASTYEVNRYALENGTRTEEPQHRVFVIELDGTRNYDFFKTLGVQYIPHLYHVAPSKASRRKPWNRALSDEIQLQSGWKTEDLERNLRSRSRLTVEVVRPPEPINWAGIAVTLLGGASLIAFFSTVGRPLIAYMVSPRTMLVASFLFYAFCVSGGMYNRIRNTPWDDGQGNMFASGSRGQFGAESVLVGFLYIFMALAIILLNTGVHSTKMSSGYTRSFAAAGVLAIVVLVWRQLLAIYTIKNPSFQNNFVVNRYLY